jgi:hypothetical protein
MARQPRGWCWTHRAWTGASRAPAAYRDAEQLESTRLGTKLQRARGGSREVVLPERRRRQGRGRLGRERSGWPPPPRRPSSPSRSRLAQLRLRGDGGIYPVPGLWMFSSPELFMRYVQLQKPSFQQNCELTLILQFFSRKKVFHE